MSLRERMEDPLVAPAESVAPSPEGLAIDEAPSETALEVPTHPITETVLRDCACFRGQVDDAGLPCGHGVLYTALGTHQYAGTFVSGEVSSRQRGAQLLPNGALYAGDFDGDYPDGHGVKRDPFGSQFIGQWHDGELDGLGLSVDVDGEARWGRFHLNELEANVAWTGATQHHVLRGLLAERNALQDQETARALELCVMLQGLTSIDATPFRSSEQVDEFTHDEQRTLDAFLDETRRALSDVERDADRWKFQEAQLKERQKNLRREISETRTALSYAAKYVGLAETRRLQLTDAERTLQSLQLQIQSMEQQLEVGENGETETNDPPPVLVSVQARADREEEKGACDGLTDIPPHNVGREATYSTNQ